LQALGLNVFYGRAQALHDVTLEVGVGELVALVGRNGAGKSTTLKALCGLQPPQSGEILFAGETLTGRAVYEIARKGVAFVPEDRQVFGNLTTAENLAVALIAKGARRFTTEDVYELFPQLAVKRGTLAENLSGGEQQMLAVARALLTGPRLLLLDEPTEGLAPLVAEAVISALRAINAVGVGLIIVEQNFRFTATLAARQYLLDGGKVIWSGTTAELASRRADVERLLLA
jgi:branched-chain amino acid transport system ATP-binding protein